MLEVKRNGETMVGRGDNRWENHGGDFGVSKLHILRGRSGVEIVQDQTLDDICQVSGKSCKLPDKECVPRDQDLAAPT